jgi:hypothetical protein
VKGAGTGQKHQHLVTGCAVCVIDRFNTVEQADDFLSVEKGIDASVYREGAVPEYPQSGERICRRRKIQSYRAAQPNRKRRGGSVCLNSLAGFVKWVSASVMPRPGLAAAY